MWALLLGGEFILCTEGLAYPHPVISGTELDDHSAKA
jgi:hypothetical protein